MIKYIGVIAGVLVAAVLLYAAIQPNTFRVERSVSINASPDRIFPFMIDFHKGDLWSPYVRKNPSMKRTFSGAEAGKGAMYEFDGNKKVEKGRLEIIETVPPAKVVLTLDMIKPVQAHNIVEYTLEPKSDTTVVTWALYGSNTYLGKIVCVFVNMDRVVGKDISDGLSYLKALVEKTK